MLSERFPMEGDWRPGVVQWDKGRGFSWSIPGWENVLLFMRVTFMRSDSSVHNALLGPQHRTAMCQSPSCTISHTHSRVHTHIHKDLSLMHTHIIPLSFSKLGPASS